MKRGALRVFGDNKETNLIINQSHHHPRGPYFFVARVTARARFAPERERERERERLNRRKEGVATGKKDDDCSCGSSVRDGIVVTSKFGISFGGRLSI